MRVWFDTEFIERGAGYPIDLISIGLVREDGAELYLESAEFDPDTANEWVRAHVLPRLRGGGLQRTLIANAVRAFAGKHPEFWGYYCDYDWVVLCQLFGTMVDLPHGWPMYCRDIKQLATSLSPEPALPATDDDEHNALADARWNRKAWDLLMTELW